MNGDSASSYDPSESDLGNEASKVRGWLSKVAEPGWLWYVKRLSANDTLLNKAHQAGPYIPKRLIRVAFPLVTSRSQSEDNPDAWFELSLDSHSQMRSVRLTWYNNRVLGTGTRNEARITQLGGSGSPLLDPESTGSLCVFAFELSVGSDSPLCRAWLCEGASEAEAVEDVTGTIEPGEGTVYSPTGALEEVSVPRDRPCWLTEATMPQAWRLAFPSASAIVELAVQHMVRARGSSTSADKRLVVRRDCEYEMFRSVEEAHVLPRIREGFTSVDSFVDAANSITNRRKSRSGASLELHAHHIFLEDGLPHEMQVVTEGKKRPDFIFPSAAAYHDNSHPSDKLRMLATKTTCKDRWRQVINEADRIPRKHLLTLQEGVSPQQHAEMEAHGICLVVPRPLHRKYPESIRPRLMTLEDFVSDTRACTDAG